MKKTQFVSSKRRMSQHGSLGFFQWLTVQIGLIPVAALADTGILGQRVRVNTNMAVHDTVKKVVSNVEKLEAENDVLKEDIENLKKEIKAAKAAKATNKAAKAA